MMYATHQQTTNSKSGFTLIELVVVIAIIGVLASAVTTNVNETRAIARDTQRLADMSSITLALTLFKQTYGRYPGPTEGVPTGGQMIGVGNPIDTALAPFLSGVPIDPLHDAGTGSGPTAGALYFYSYDPWHWVGILDCTDTTNASAGVVYGFNKAETLTEPDKVTCMGSDMNLDDADYNRQLQPIPPGV